MTTPRGPRFDTLSLHAGQRPDPATGARAVPIYQTTSFVFDDTEHAASLFNLERAGHIYSRISNPTVAVLEERISALEGGVGAVATASGQAALHLIIATLMGAGGHIVASSRIYGGSHNMFTHTLPRFGITTTLVDPRDHKSFERAITDKTRLVLPRPSAIPAWRCWTSRQWPASPTSMRCRWRSTPRSPRRTCAGRSSTAPTSSCTRRPSSWAATASPSAASSSTADASTGWRPQPSSRRMTEPYAGYHGITYAEEFGPAAFIMRARTEGLRDFGACMSPANAFYLLQGIETLPVRMARHVANAETVARFLEKHAAVAWVKYPGLESHPDHALAKRQMPKGAGAILSFGIKGGRKAGARLIERLKVFSHLANVGDAKILVIHPASTTHQQMSVEELAEAGVGEELVRLSIGLEDPQDLTDDLDQALAASQKG